MIELSQFRKEYDDCCAVDDLTLKIEPGELFGFIGPNGAGKSTTIRFLVTLLKPTSGDGIVAGHSVVRDPLGVRRHVGYMPDHFGVYEGMRVWEFLDFFAAAYEIPHAKRRRVIDDVLDLLDLGGKRDALVQGLSRGVKQRLCLAKTLVHDPPVLILDEPTSGLDPRARLEVKALLKELRGMGKTILISSHILSELADCCTSIGILEQGKLLLHGPIDLLQRQWQQRRLIQCQVLTGLDVAQQVARNQPETRGVRVEGGRMHVELTGGDEPVARLLEQLLASGVRLTSYVDREPTLEDLFMTVTRGLVS